MLSAEPLPKLANFVKLVAAPMRLAILLALGEGEACVCHLTTLLSQRQAVISQHLMALRRAEILQDRREGRFIYYRLADPAILPWLRDAGRLAGVSLPNLPATPVTGCSCPPCAGQTVWLPLETVTPPTPSPQL
jgi:DNA-binding transcriptional ArsR family regulator